MSSSYAIQIDLLKLNKESSAQYYLTGYVSNSVRGKSRNILQQCLFIRGIKEHVDSVNAKEQQIS